MRSDEAVRQTVYAATGVPGGLADGMHLSVFEGGPLSVAAVLSPGKAHLPSAGREWVEVGGTPADVLHGPPGHSGQQQRAGRGELPLCPHAPAVGLVQPLEAQPLHPRPPSMPATPLLNAIGPAVDSTTWQGRSARRRRQGPLTMSVRFLLRVRTDEPPPTSKAYGS
ncbi:hypothetical protein [Streptomyces tailanensis]|uniref:hypothetical protein n=1 Tax=Streptomyces tailanensis TaxID=2569858 RepID=UPI00122DDE8F|nr:hypothetical protein [Streptomyces tailanensis]